MQKCNVKQYIEVQDEKTGDWKIIMLKYKLILYGINSHAV